MLIRGHKISKYKLNLKKCLDISAGIKKKNKININNILR